VVTFVALYLTQRRALAQDTLAENAKAGKLESGALLAAAGIFATTAVLVAASALDRDLGAPTAIAGALTAVASLIRRREGPWPLVKNISWSVLPLVAGLFVLVEAFEYTGVVAMLADELKRWADAAPLATSGGAGLLVALVCNLVNNLPAGLIAGAAVQSAHASPDVASSLLIGVDLGPNLSVTGSLATILWLHALRRENLTVSVWRFLGVGAVVMIPSLIAALAVALAMTHFH
jgi:arsenical pump membrane protein